MTFFYVTAVFLFSQNSLNTSFSDYENTPDENQAYFQSVSTGLLAIPPAQEPFAFNFTTAKYQNSDYHFKEFSACIRNIEQAGSSEFFKYIFSSVNFPVKLRKADLLYPFHYFW